MKPDREYTLVDLSHEIEDGTITYKGLPAPVICDYLSREESRKFYPEGTEFQIGKIEMVANTGTYVDCPFHRYADGKDLASVELERFVDLPCEIVHVPYAETLEIGPSFFECIDVKGKAVLVYTGWSEHWNTDAYFENHPFLTEETALYLRDQGATLVGIDSHNIDDTRGNARPVHSVLLGADILVAEHLCNIKNVPLDKPCLFTAAPPKFKGVGTFPVRAYIKD